ncbi:MAG: hypothetical protein GX051_08145 [Clostridiales bacterium]|nr:hypothetical protein [Clostridiales bacterium]
MYSTKKLIIVTGLFVLIFWGAFIYTYGPSWHFSSKKAQIIYDKNRDPVSEVGIEYNGKKYYDLYYSREKYTEENPNLFTCKTYISPYGIKGIDYDTKIYPYRGEAYAYGWFSWEMAICAVEDDPNHTMWIETGGSGQKIFLEEGFKFPSYNVDKISTLKLQVYSTTDKGEILITDQGLINEIISGLESKSDFSQHIKDSASWKENCKYDLFVYYDNSPLYEYIGYINSDTMEFFPERMIQKNAGEQNTENTAA